MTGTEKQTKWATSIKASLLNELDAGKVRFSLYQGRITANFSGSVPATTEASWNAMLAALDSLMGRIQCESDSQWFIEAARKDGLDGLLRSELERVGEKRAIMMIKKVLFD